VISGNKQQMRLRLWNWRHLRLYFTFLNDYYLPGGGSTAGLLLNFQTETSKGTEDPVGDCWLG
jgi:hypothetical protein